MTMLPDKICPTCSTYWHSYEYYACPKCNPNHCKVYYPPKSKEVRLKSAKGYRDYLIKDIKRLNGYLADTEKTIKKLEDD